MKASRKILKNMFSLSVAEAANKGIQFIYTAYLGRVLAPDGFGVFAWANAYFLYFLLVVNLGFNTLGIREIAQQPGKINKYVNSITSIRLLLAFVSYIALFFSVMLMGKSQNEQYVVWIAGFNLFSNAILLDWVYQGTEKMEILALRQFITSLLNLVGIFIFVHSKEHLVIAMAVIVISTALNSIWMLLVYIKSYGKVSFDLDFPFLKAMLKSSVPIAFTSFFSAILNNFSILFLGFISAKDQTGFYMAAFKIYLVTMIPSAVIQSAFFPVVSRANTFEEKHRTMQKFTMLQFMFGAILAGLFFTYADFLVLFVFKDAFYESVPLLRILMLTCIVVYINITYTPPLIAWYEEKKVMYVLIAGGAISIVANIILISLYEARGAALATIIGESAVALGLGYMFYKSVGHLYLFNLLKFLVYSAASCGAGYFLTFNGFSVIAAGSVSVVLYIIINMLFKTVTIRELKGYFAK